ANALDAGEAELWTLHRTGYWRADEDCDVREAS
ncbi:MAG: hypothetical protein ACI8RZ_000987, partial [Myxococcota bacterium]